MPMEIHEDKIIMRAGQYKLPKPWVDLLDDEWQEIADTAKTTEEAMQEVARRLKEKNDENK